MLKLAAIDIGSNAIRLQITHVIDYEGSTTFKRLEYVRFPLRLGQDVFNVSEDNPLRGIGPQRADKFMKLMHAFKLLIDLYEVDDYLGCATSAMREAENGRELVERAQEELGLEIQIIDGDAEADMLNQALVSFLDDGKYLHIDVGGGSTELNVFVNREKVAAHSFPIGSVRRLNPHVSLDKVWKEMQQWIRAHVKPEYGKVTAIGTGGNINKIFDLSGKKLGKTIALSRVISVRDYVASHTLDERINKLQLNADRADVLVPAAEIYISAMKWAHATQILVPNVGLKDGIMPMLYMRHQVNG